METTVIANTNTNTTTPVLNNNNNELNAALREINGVLETAINTNTVLNTDEISEVLGAIRGVLETITETTANENEVLIDTLFSDEDNELNEESKTWTEECFLDRMGASQELKEWANLVSEMFWRRNEVGYNNHPDWTVVSVPTRFRDEVRALMEGNSLPYSPGMVVHPGVWYYPADREFEIVE